MYDEWAFRRFEKPVIAEAVTIATATAAVMTATAVAVTIVAAGDSGGDDGGVMTRKRAPLRKPYIAL